MNSTQFKELLIGGHNLIDQDLIITSTCENGITEAQISNIIRMDAAKFGPVRYIFHSNKRIYSEREIKSTDLSIYPFEKSSSMYINNLP